jgi:hypothetical protein
MASALNADMRTCACARHLVHRERRGEVLEKDLGSTTKVFIFSKLLSTDVLREIWREVTRKNAEARLEGIDSRVGTAAPARQAKGNGGFCGRSDLTFVLFVIFCLKSFVARSEPLITQSGFAATQNSNHEWTPMDTNEEAEDSCSMP